MFIIEHRKIWYILSGTLVAVSLFSIFYFGLNLGIDFTGGSLLEIEYNDRMPSVSDMRNKLSESNFNNVSLQPSGEKNLIVRSKALNDEEHQAILNVLKTFGPLNEVRFDSIGPVIGKELQQKSWIAIVLVALMIILYIAFAFRKVSKPVSSFKYGLTAVIALRYSIHHASLSFGM